MDKNDVVTAFILVLTKFIEFAWFMLLCTMAHKVVKVISSVFKK